MIEVIVSLDSAASVLRDVEILGHAKRGETEHSTVCAAVSALVRTAGRTIEARGSIPIDGRADSPGSLRFSIEKPANIERADLLWLQGVSEYFMTGIRDIACEHPDECRLRVVTEGDEYGT
jgi:uncharacterized protein YsxB (DUF464 family)